MKKTKVYYDNLTVDQIVEYWKANLRWRMIQSVVARIRKTCKNNERVAKINSAFDKYVELGYKPANGSMTEGDYSESYGKSAEKPKYGKKMRSTLVWGVGVCERGKYKMSYVDPADGKKKNTAEYRLWCDMIARCYDEKRRSKWPAYAGCTVSDNFLNFQWFAEWCNNQIGFKVKDENGTWQMDKDMLVKGNRVYSEDTCVFIPRCLNLVAHKNKHQRNGLPIGVSLYKTAEKTRYKARCSLGEKGKEANLGYHSTVEEAFAAYKKFKESFIKERADQFKGKIDDRVYNALMSYEVRIDD
jgi:hypothetical protein